MMLKERARKLAVSLAACLLFVSFSAAGVPAPDRATSAQLASIRNYIKQNWRTLTRSNAKLASTKDTKLLLASQQVLS